MTTGLDLESGELWVFGYGSLMWRPGFDFLERHVGRVTGLHRSLCVYSHVHRGTPEKPGLVLGLDRGGACTGIAFRVAARNRAETLAYLRAREQITSVYLEVVRPVLLRGLSQPIRAVAYVVDRGHRQYAGKLALADQLHHVRQGHGQSGPNIEYVLSTVGELRRLGLRDSGLESLARELGGAAHPGHAARPRGLRPD
jgi:cation transport protein ChaC